MWLCMMTAIMVNTTWNNNKKIFIFTASTRKKISSHPLKTNNFNIKIKPWVFILYPFLQILYNRRNFPRVKYSRKEFWFIKFLKRFGTIVTLYDDI